MLIAGCTGYGILFVICTLLSWWKRYDKFIKYVDDERNWKKCQGIICDKYSKGGDKGHYNGPWFTIGQYFSYRVILPYLDSPIPDRSEESTKRIVVTIKHVCINSFALAKKPHIQEDEEFDIISNDATANYFYNKMVGDIIDIEYCVNPFYFESIDKWNIFCDIKKILNNYISAHDNKENGYLCLWFGIGNCMHFFVIGQYFIQIKKTRKLARKVSKLAISETLQKEKMFGIMIGVTIMLTSFLFYYGIGLTVFDYVHVYWYCAEYFTLCFCAILAAVYQYFNAITWSIFFAKHFAFLGATPIYSYISNGTSTHVKQANQDDIEQFNKALILHQGAV